MSGALTRGSLLLEQGRYVDAEQQLRRAVGEDPQDSVAHRLLALALANLKRYQDAQDEAEVAIGLAPNDAWAFYVAGVVMCERNRLDDAMKLVDQAVELDPEEAKFRELAARVHLAERRWPSGLEAAEAGLAIDPENVACLNLRATALTQLGRHDEAGTDVFETLRKAPDDAESHATLGWSLMHQHRPKEAMTHFREALRLDPECGWARSGIMEAMKARNPIYGMILRYFLWMSRLSSGTQWGIIIGLYLANRVVAGIAATNPELKPWLQPVLWLYVGFVLLTWLSYPLFNLVLFTDRFGRYVLNRDEKLGAACVGINLVVAAGCLAFGLVLDESLGISLALTIGVGTLPLAGAFMVPIGWPRWVMLGLYAVSVVVGTLADYLEGWVMIWLVIILGSQFLANRLQSVRVRR